MTKHIHRTLLTTLLSAPLALGLSGCGDQKEPQQGSGGGNTSSELKAVFLDSAPAGAVSVVEARKTAKPEAEITVVGRIAGTMHPFTQGYATLVLADESLETCERVPGDTCKTPWDACCVPKEILKVSRASIQVNGDDGKPMTQSLKGAGGLTELDTIVVTGKVAKSSTPENLIIEASRIYRKPSS